MRHILKLACTDHSRYACIAYSAWITSPLLGCPCPWIIFSCDIDFSSLLPWEGPKTPLTDVAGCVSSHEVSRGVNCFFDSRILFLGCRQTTEAQGRRALGISAIMFRSKRKDSAIRTLVAETLVLAKTHGYVEKIEHELEEELQRENTEPPNKILAKWRRNGEKILKNKYTLLTVALFCVTECALILGELILDLRKVKDVLTAKDISGQNFLSMLRARYPGVLASEVDIDIVYDAIARSCILWTSNLNESQSEVGTSRYDLIAQNNESQKRTCPEHMDWIYGCGGNRSSMGDNSTLLKGRVVKSSSLDSVETHIAKAFHMASIAILSILVIQTLLKALCAGTDFFHRKLETFDLCVVLISFVVDLVCNFTMPYYKIEDFAFILAFLLPWRVIRVVNSLVVAVQDHEHFRLKLIYDRKKKIVNSLRESEIKLQLFRAQCNALKRLCFNEGIGESKIDQILMVEECIVNKAGKSKCKIKIDNSSVILLNDKSDFPRLSPRPSLLNLAVDKLGRRKSMLPQCLTGGGDKEIYPNNSKDSLTKGATKQRARSNSESGRGTLSSPDESSANKNLLGEEKYYGGLNTPIIVNRKSSLSSPIMATHVRNILNSLEDKCNQMNGTCNRPGGGRGSVDSESIAEEKEPISSWGRKVQSIDESSNEGISFSCSRRASLQPQQCVDEVDDDDDIILPAIGSGTSGATKKSSRNSLSKTIVITAPDSCTQQAHRFSIPTTIQIDPPSNSNSNYSLSSGSSSNNSNSGSNRNSYAEKAAAPCNLNISSSTETSNLKAPHQDDSLLTQLTSIVSCTSDGPIVLDQNPTCASCASQPNSKPANSASFERKGSGSSQSSTHSATSTNVNNLKPKTLRTPSDIENENNLTQTESSDVCVSNEDCTRNTSIEEIEDEFDNSDSLVSISEKDAAVLSGSSLVSQHNDNNGLDSSDTLQSSSPLSPDSGKSNIDDVTRRSGGMASFIVSAVDQDLSSDSTSNLLS